MATKYTGEVLPLNNSAAAPAPATGAVPVEQSLTKDEEVFIATKPAAPAQAAPQKGAPTAAPAKAAAAGDLPSPSLSMYDDLGRGDAAVKKAMGRYDQYRNHPESKRGVLGEVIYKGKIVPMPDSQSFIFKDPSPSTGYNFYGAGRNLVKNVLETGAAIADVTANKLDEKMNLGGLQLFDKNWNWNPKYFSPQEWSKLQKGQKGQFTNMTDQIAELDAGRGIFDNITVEGGQLIGGGAAGLKLAKKGLETIPKLANSKYVSAIGKVLGFEVGAATGANDTASTVLVGQNAMFKGLQEYVPLLKGIPEGTSDTDADRILKNRMNILVDAAMLAKPAESVVKGTVWATRLGWSVTLAPLLNVGSRSAQEEAIAKEILDRLATVGSKNDEASNAARTEIVRLIKENQNVFTQTNDQLLKDMNFSLDTMSSLEKALKNNNTDEARQIIAQARAMRSGVVNSKGGAPALVDKMGAPGRAFEATTRNVEQGLGGTPAIDKAKRDIVASGEARVGAADFDVTSARSALDDAERNVVTLIREDPTFGTKLDQLSRASGINIYSGRNQAADEIVGNVRRAYETMKAEKDGLYSAIEGGPLDVEGMVRILDRLRPGQLDAAAGALPANSQFGDLLDVTKRRMVAATDEAGAPVLKADGTPQMRIETPEERIARVTSWAERNELDFGRMYREIRPTVSASAENLFTAAQPEAKAAGQALRDFATWIDNDALEFVVRNGDQEVADAATAAKEYYVTQFAPFWRDGALARVADTYESTVGRTSQGMRDNYGVEFKPVEFQAQTRQQLTGVLNEANREYADQLVNILGREEGGNSARLVTDYVLGDILGGLSAKLKSGARLSEIDTADVVTRLTEYGSILSRNFPDEAARLSTFIDNLNGAKGNVENLRGAVTAAEEAAAKARDELYNGELSLFFRKEGMEVPNAYAAFEQLFSGQQNETTLRNILDRANAEGNPFIREGIQAAYSRYIRNKFLGATEELGGNRVLKLGAANASEEEISNILKYGEMVFENRPEIIDATRSLLDAAGLVTRSKGAKAVASDSPTAARTEATQAMNRLVTNLVGVLSRTGARIRNVSTTLIAKLSPDEAAFRMLDAMYADPKYFTEVAERVINKNKGAMSEDSRDMLYAFFVRSGVYNDDTQDRQSFLSAIADAELGARNVEAQTREIFGGPRQPVPIDQLPVMPDGSYEQR